MSLLDILKCESCGLTLEKLIQRAHENGINNPLPQLKALVEQGLVRIDKNPAPVRYKATNLAFA